MQSRNHASSLATGLLGLFLLSPSPSAQEDAPSAQELLDRAEEKKPLVATPEARALWDRLLAASRGTNAEPIAAFRLRAEASLREGAQRNDLDIEYAYLAPQFIRFKLSSKRETGRFGPAQRDYWLRDGNEVVFLAGREYTEDRRQVDRMLAVARNFTALSSPETIELTRLEVLQEAPRDLPRRMRATTKGHAWLRVESPSLALFEEDAQPPRPMDLLVQEPKPYRADFGIAPSGRPSHVVIRPPAGETRVAPLLIQLQDFETRAGYQVPQALLVHERDPSAPERFADLAAQEIYITSIDLAPELEAASFHPQPEGTPPLSGGGRRAPDRKD